MESCVSGAIDALFNCPECQTIAAGSILPGAQVECYAVGLTKHDQAWLWQIHAKCIADLTSLSSSYLQEVPAQTPILPIKCMWMGDTLLGIFSKPLESCMQRERASFA